MMLHGLCVGEEAGARNRAFFRVKWLQPGMKATSSVWRLRLGSFGSFATMLVPAYVVLCVPFLKFLLKSVSKSSFCRFGVEIHPVLELQFPTPLHVVLLCFATQSADRIGMAASRLLGAAAACVILLFFVAEDRKSYWNGCIKAATVICQQIFAILALILFL